MKIALWSDWHLGTTKDKSIMRQFALMAEQKPDLVVAGGDYNGGWYGAKATRTVFRRFREAMPDVPSCGVLGNHEHWIRGRKAGFTGDHLGKSFQRPSAETWRLNYLEIQRVFEENKIHFLDLAGPMRLPDHPGIAIVGHTLWYEKAQPPTNDLNFMPYSMDGDTHAFMRRNAYREAFDNLDKLTDEDMTRVFVSHFPVINVKGDHEFEQFSASAVFGESLQATFRIQKFLCGHAHQYHNGPLRFEAGSDYGRPKFLMIEI